MRRNTSRNFGGIDQYTKLYVPCIGANDSTSIKDLGVLNKAIQMYGNAKLSTSVFKNNGSSCSFDGTNSYITWDSSAINLGVANSLITIDFWVYWNADTELAISNIGGSGSSYTAGSFALYYTNGSGWTFGRHTGSGTSVLYSRTNTGWTPTLNTWYHFSFVWNANNTANFYMNGISIGLNVASSADSISMGSAPYYNVGRDSTHYFNGYLSDLRISEGTDRGWNTPYIQVDSAPIVDKNVVLHLPMNGVNSGTSFNDTSLYNRTITNTGTVTSTTQSKFGGSSGYFNGSSSILTVPNDTTLVLGAKQFYMSFWIYMTSAPNYQAVMGHGTDTDNFWTLQYRNTGAYLGWFFYWYASGVWQIACNEGGNGQTLNAWAHIALVRNGSTFSIYRNGTRICTGTNANVIPTFTGLLSVGADVQCSFYINGNICDVTLLTDTSLGYTGGETTIPIPTAPFPSYQQDITAFTKLWIPGYGANNATDITDRSAYGRAITNTNVAVSTSRSKFNGSSLYFDGNTGSLKTSYSKDLDFGTKNFTISCWVNFHTLTYDQNFQTIFSQSDSENTNGDNKNYLSIHSSQGLYWVITSGGSDLAVISQGSNDYSVDTWYHIAVVRSGDSFSIYRNGTRLATASYAGAIPTLTATNHIGYSHWGGGYERRLKAYLFDFICLNGTDTGYSGATIPVPSKPFTLDGVPQRPYTVQPYDGITNGIDKYTKLYLPLSEPSNTFIDKSFYGRTITNTGVVSSTTQTKFGGSSAYFNGAGTSYLSVPDSDDFPGGTTPFAVTCWLKDDKSYGANVYSLLFGQYIGWNDCWIVLYGVTNGQMALNIKVGTGGTALMQDLTPFTLSSSWTYWAFVWDGAYLDTYQNGTRISHYAAAFTWPNIATNLSVGGFSGSGNYLQGYMSDLQIVKGNIDGFRGTTIEVPTKPAETPFPLPRKQLAPTTIANPVLYIKGYSPTDSNTIIYDSSPYARSITNTNVVTRTTNQRYGPSSMYFSGTQRLSVAEIVIGANDFCISYWVYQTVGSQFQRHITSTTGGATSGTLIIRLNTSNQVAVVFGAGGANGSTILSLNRWYHVMLVRTNGTCYLYVDGVLNATFAGSDNITESTYSIGGYYSNTNSEWFSGYMSEIMISIGTNMGYIGSTIPVPTGSLSFQ